MIWSYLKIATRLIRKNSLVSFINIFGLGLAMSVGMMIMIRVQDQFSYDNFHPAAGKTFRILTNFEKKGGEKIPMASTPLPLLEKLEHNDVVKAAVNIYPAVHEKVFIDDKEFYLGGAFTQPDFFTVFGFTLLAGNETEALAKPNSIVLTKNTAFKFFGHADPMGKIIRCENGTIYTVTGVLDSIPGKSHLNFDSYASAATITRLEKSNLLPAQLQNWFEFNTAYTYVRLQHSRDLPILKNQLAAISLDLNKKIVTGKASFAAQRLDKITPGKDYLAYELSGGSSWSKIWIETGISLLILFAACFNYTNLTIARALTRAREVGVRKIAGAKRHQLFAQYITESMFVALLALLFAWLILTAIVRYAPFNDGYEFIPSSFRYNPAIVMASVVFALFSGLLAGSAPAWILSAFKPLLVLKNLSTARTFGKLSLQKFFIVFQYSLSLTIIIFLFAFYRQFSFLGNVNPGFATENVIVMPLNGLDAANTAARIGNVSGVKSVGAMSSNITGRFSGMRTQAWHDKEQQPVSLNYYQADADFIRQMQFSLIAGRGLQNTAGLDDKILINEQAVLALGFKNAGQSLGQTIYVNDSTQWQVSGVLKDFKYEGAGRAVQPLAIRTRPGSYNYLYIQTTTADEAVTDRIQQAMQYLQPTAKPELRWLRDILAENNSQAATISLLGFLAFIALSIASLGLLGLVIYSIEVRRKEISIRKIIGASQQQLVKKLSGSFLKLIIIAGLIAMPIGFVLSFFFLQNFSERISFGLTEVVLCFLFLFCIGLVTIITQTYRAAAANPAEHLRAE